LLLGLFLLDLGLFAWFRTEMQRSGVQEPETLSPELEKYAAVLHSEHQRLFPVAGADSSLHETRPNTALLYSLPIVSGYGPLGYARLLEMLGFDLAASSRLFWADSDNRGLDIMSVRYAFVPSVDPKRKPLIRKQNLNWTESNLDLVFASPGNYRKAYDVLFPSSHFATHVGIVSALRRGDDLADDTRVLRIIATDVDGHTHRHVLLVGRHTASTTYGWQGTPPKHKQAQVFSQSQARPGSSAQVCQYMATLSFGGRFNIKSIRFEWVGPNNSVIHVSKITLWDRDTKTSVPVSITDVQLSDTERWHDTGERILDTAVFENRRAMPRVWLVSKVANLAPDTVLRTIQTSKLPNGTSFEPSELALVEERVDLDTEGPSEPGTANITEFEPCRMGVRTQATSESLLITSDSYFPGWEATVDGKPTRIYRANYVLRAVKVPPGKHEVHFRFRPKPFYHGATLSGVSLLLLALFASGYVRGKDLSPKT